MKRFIIGTVLLAGGAMWLSTLLGIWDFSGLWQQPWTHYVLAVTALLAGLHFLSGGNRHDWHMRPLPAPKGEGQMHCSVSFSGSVNGASAIPAQRATWVAIRIPRFRRAPTATAPAAVSAAVIRPLKWPPPR